ncbi:LOW QUALITY PROTEIN: cell division cycle protein 16 homolog [Clytia hemisphaerica]
MADDIGGKLNLTQIRNLVRQYIDIHLYDSALFWADKVCTLSKNDQKDVIWLAHCLFLSKQPLRAAQLLKSKGLTSTNLLGRYLAAKCFVECKEWRSALDVLDGEEQELKTTFKESINTNPLISTSTSTIAADDDGEFSAIISSSLSLPYAGSSKSRKLEAAVSLLKGTVYEALENRQIATQCFKDALQHDIYCFEAFNLLVSHHSLTSAEENQLLESLPYNTQCNEEEAKLLRFVYKNLINKYSKPVEELLPPVLQPMTGNLDYIVSLAEKYFNNSNFREALRYTKYVLKVDNLHEGCLPLYISCLSILKMTNELYNLAHRLVNTYPTRSVSWYAIGSYYLMIKKNESARKYFGKATSINNTYGPAWLGFAHSFSSDGEKDQAISAYFSASQYMPGSHLPFLNLGREYAQSHDLKLAMKFYKEAMSIAPHDPHIKLELGTLAYENGEYQKAESLLLDCLKKVSHVENDPNTFVDIWEPLFNNLGHVMRKLGKYEDALDYHKQAYQMAPKNSGTCAAMGLCYLLASKYTEAVSILHKALSLKRDDTLSMQLLNEALKSLSAIESSNIENIDPLEESLEQSNATKQSISILSMKDSSVIDADETSDFDGCKTTNMSDVMEMESTMEDCSNMSLEMSDL